MSSLTKKPTRWPYLGLLGWTIGQTTVIFILDLFLPWVFKSRVHFSTKPWVHCPFKSIAGRSTPPSGTDSFRVVVCQLSLQNKKNIKRKQLISIFWLKKNSTAPIPSRVLTPPRSLQCWGFNSSPKAKILHRMAWQKKTKKNKKQIEQFNWQLDASVDSSKFGQLFCRKKVPGRSAREGFRVPGPVVLMCWFFSLGCVGLDWLVGWLGVFVTYKLPMFFL